MLHKLSVTRQNIRQGLVVSVTTGFMLLATQTLATETLHNQPSIRLGIGHAPDATLLLDVRQAPLGQVLAEIASQTGVNMHYDQLPEQLVTIQCTTTNLKPLLDCLLLNQNINIVSRYPQDEQQTLPAEIWLLQRTDHKTPTSSTLTPVPVTLVKDPAAEARLALLLLKAKDADPGRRANAIAQLLNLKSGDQASISQAIKAGLADEDATVRARTVTHLSHYQGEQSAATELETALQDNDASVRLMAVDATRNNSALLEQALGDSDAGVRSLAAQRLAELNKRNNGQ